MTHPPSPRSRRLRRARLLLIAAVLLPTLFLLPATAQGAQRVQEEPSVSLHTDINTPPLYPTPIQAIGGANNGTQVMDSLVAGDRLFLIVHREVPAAESDYIHHADELWVSDGSQAGTRPVVTLQLADDWWHPIFRWNEVRLEMAYLDGVLLTVLDENDITSVWYSDGTREGTRRVALDATVLGVVGEQLLMMRRNGPASFQLMSANRTFLRGHSLGSYATGRPDLEPPVFAMTDSMLYFLSTGRISAPANPWGVELWQSDGTRAGTRLALDLDPGPNDSHISLLIPGGESLFFVAPNGPLTALWRYDPASGQAAALGSADELTRYPIFRMLRGGNDIYIDTVWGLAHTLWHLDQRDGRLTQLPGIYDLTDWVITAGGLEMIGYWGLDIPSQPGPQEVAWWRWDPATGERTTLHVFESDAQSVYYPWIRAELAHLDGLTFAVTEAPAADPAYRELAYAVWQSDGSEAGTTLIAPLARPYPAVFMPTAYDGRLYYMADGGSTGIELHVYEPGGAPAVVADLSRKLDGDRPDCLVEEGGRLIISLADPGYQVTLWTSDGTEAGTVPFGERLGSIWVRSLCGDTPLRLGESRMFLTADSAAEGHRRLTLWALDPGAHRPRVVYEWKRTAGEDPGVVFVTGERLYLNISSSDRTILWTSDGTGAGTEQVLTPEGEPLEVGVGTRFDAGTPAGETLYLRVYTNLETLYWQIRGARAEQIDQSGHNVSWIFYQGAADRLFGWVEFIAPDDSRSTHLVTVPNETNVLETVMDLDGYTPNGYHLNGTFESDLWLLVTGERFHGLFTRDGDGAQRLLVSDGTVSGTGWVDLDPAPPAGTVRLSGLLVDGDDTYFNLWLNYQEVLVYRWRGNSPTAAKVPALAGVLQAVDGRLLVNQPAAGDQWVVGWFDPATETVTPFYQSRYLAGAMAVDRLQDDRLVLTFGGQSLMATDGTAAGSRMLRERDDFNLITSLREWEKGITVQTQGGRIWHSDGWNPALLVVDQGVQAEFGLSRAEGRLVFVYDLPEVGMGLYTLGETPAEPVGSLEVPEVLRPEHRYGELSYMPRLVGDMLGLGFAIRE